MALRKTTLVGGLVAALLCLGAQAAPALAAPPTTPVPAPAGHVGPPVAAAAQAAHADAVARFLAAHPKPAALTASASAAALTQNRADWYRYLKAAPWTDLYGQWGCTVSAVTVQMSAADDGNTYPTVQSSANCGGVQALTAVAGTLDTKATVLAQPSNAQLRTQLSTATAQSGATVSPMSTASNCANVSSTYL